MGYKIQEHQVKEVEFTVYQTASNGEVCKRIASCRSKEDAELIMSLLRDKEAARRAL